MYFMDRIAILEVLSKKIIKRDGFLWKYLRKRSLSSGDETKHDPSEYYKLIDNSGITKGDIVIVHSSMEEMSKFNINAVDLINHLLSVIGPEGTLAIPAFPYYKEVKEILEYDRNKTLCWTGILPNIFLRYPEVIRSEFPYNSLAAKGPHAEAMMKDNLLDDKVYGKHSAWVYCSDHHAKVLFLGTPAFHTTTVSHICEDLLGEKWPIKEFYKKQKFLLKEKEGTKEFEAFVRREFWYDYNTSYHRTYLLKKKGILKDTSCHGVYFGYIDDVNSVVKYLSELAVNGKPMYYVPRKYRK